ncbi:MAG: cytochrome B, partial [Halobacteriaceae archaeon]
MEITRRQLAIALVVVFVVNLVVMSAGAYLAYKQSPSRPDQFVGPNGEVIITAEEMKQGKVVFQRNGLMNHGTILGNGAYFGVDFTADTIDLVVKYMRRYIADKRYGITY